MGEHDEAIEGTLVEAALQESLPMRAAMTRMRARLFGADVAPTRIDRFELLGVIGRGASGVVHRAHDPTLQREVAVKVYPKHADPALTRRIKREARVVARLSHPNVVTVFGVGEDQGRLWVVMELIEGETLRPRIEAGVRGWSSYRSMALSIGRGIEAAHRAGIVHRDIKPENILLGRDGRVAVADFGLAIAAPTTLEGSTMTTSLGGTPAYMSPEQLRGVEAGPASDQFSFCVTVVEAVVGRRPFQGSTGEAMLAAMREGPGAALEGADIPRVLSRALARGLAFEPAERFPSMTELLAALERNRRGWPVLLGVGVVVGAAAFALDLEPERCTGAADELEPTWNEGRRASLAEAFSRLEGPLAAQTWSRVERRVDGFAEDWAAFHAHACRTAADPRTLDAQMFCLDAQRVALDATLRTLERVSSASLENAATLSGSLGEPTDCADPDVEVLPTDPEVIGLRNAVLEAGVALTAGEHEDAERMAAEAVEDAEARGQGRLRGRALVALGAARLYQGKDGRSVLEQAYAQAAEVGDGQTQLHAALLSSTAHATDPDQAERWMRMAEALVERIEAPARLRVLALDRRGALAGSAGDLDAAQASLQAARSIVEEEGLADSELGARVVQNLAQVAMLQGRLEDAVGLQRRVLEVRERVLGPSHPTFGVALAALGTTLVHAERYDEAESMLQRALEVFAASVGDEHVYAHKARMVLASVLHLKGRLEEARVEYERAAAMLERARPEGDRETIVILSNLADIATQQHRLDEAAKIQDRVVTISRRLDAGTLGLADQLEAMGEIRQLQGRHADAVRSFEEATELEASLLDAADARRLEALLGLGANERALGRSARARDALEQALELSFEDGAASIDRARAELELAAVLADDDIERARALARRARRRLAEAPPAQVQAHVRVGLLDLDAFDALFPDGE